MGYLGVGGRDVCALRMLCSAICTLRIQRLRLRGSSALGDEPLRLERPIELFSCVDGGEPARLVATGALAASWPDGGAPGGLAEEYDEAEALVVKAPARLVHVVLTGTVVAEAGANFAADDCTIEGMLTVDDGASATLQRRSEGNGADVCGRLSLLNSSLSDNEGRGLCVYGGGRAELCGTSRIERNASVEAQVVVLGTLSVVGSSVVVAAAQGEAAGRVDGGVVMLEGGANPAGWSAEAGGRLVVVA